MPTFYEFFAGGGMARAGLGAGWSCLFANDFDEMKGRVYSENWGDDHLLIEDVAEVYADHLPEGADLAWASFPCQDLSLAGSYAGIGHWANKELSRSGTFWPFWSLMRHLQSANIETGRKPLIVTGNRGLTLAEGLAENAGISDRLDVIEFEQFLATNIHELGEFEQSKRRTKVEELIEHYNRIIDNYETDPSLKIDLS